MNARPTAALAAALLAALIAIPDGAVAQKTVKPARTAEAPFKIERLIIGKTVRVDDAYAEKNETPEPAPFRVTLPTGEDFLTLVNAKAGGFLKATFATPDRKFLESVHLIEMDVPTDLEADRKAVVARLMSERVFASLTEKVEDAKVLVIRETKIGDMEAVEVIGRYADPEEGLIYVWIHGLPHPTSKRGTYAVSLIHHGRRPLDTDTDFATSLAGRTVQSFRYTE